MINLLQKSLLQKSLLQKNRLLKNLLSKNRLSKNRNLNPPKKILSANCRKRPLCRCSTKTLPLAIQSR